MCIAICNTKGLLERHVLFSCWTNNRDGGGFVYHTDEGTLKIIKELESFEKFYRAYESHRLGNLDKTFVLHFRVGTHGLKNKANLHPFKVNDHLAFVHNGIINGVPKDEKKSDTAMFNKTILQTMAAPHIAIKDVGVRRLIRNFTGSYNKLVFLTSDGFFHITNEEAGHWNEGNWFSNHSYKGGIRDVGGRTETYGNTATMHVKRGAGGAVRVKDVSSENLYVPAHKLRQLEANFPPDRGSIEFNDRTCEECGRGLYGRMEMYYKFCTDCLTKYGIDAED